MGKTKRKALEPDASSAHKKKDMHDAHSTCTPHGTCHVLHCSCGGGAAAAGCLRGCLRACALACCSHVNLTHFGLFRHIHSINHCRTHQATQKRMYIFQKNKTRAIKKPLRGTSSHRKPRARHSQPLKATGEPLTQATKQIWRSAFLTPTKVA